MDDEFRPVFGDFVTNPYASDDNPTKHGYFVEMVYKTGRLNTGDFYRCTDGTGRFWECKEVVEFTVTDKMRRENEQEAMHEEAKGPQALIDTA